MTISGAAASPNMGYHTSPVTAFLLTLFNVRLGWWFPNPSNYRQEWDEQSKEEHGGKKERVRWGLTQIFQHFSLGYLVAELFGTASDKSSFVNISDGGHFENLAAYELIRRQCKVVVISDAECDENYTFEGLGTLIRVCEVDFGCCIDIKVQELRPSADLGWSAKRWAAGSITYKDGTPLANLHLTLLDRVGVRLDAFGDSNGKIEELFDLVSV